MLVDIQMAKAETAYRRQKLSKSFKSRRRDRHMVKPVAQPTKLESSTFERKAA